MSDAEYTIECRVLARGAGVSGTVTLSKDRGVRFKSHTGATRAISSSDVSAMHWSSTPTGGVIRIRSRDGETLVLGGVDAGGAQAACEYGAKAFGCSSGENATNVNGRNWGEIAVVGNSAVFEVDGKTQFELDGAQIAECKMAGKNEVVFQFHNDDTVTEKDALVEMSFYVPPGNQMWAGNDIEDPEDIAANRLHAAVMSIAAAESDVGEPVAEFDSVTMVVPRGKVTIELHPAHMKMTSSTVDFKVPYSSIVRVYLLPRPHSNQSHAVIALDPPIRKGQTFYPQILAMFNDDEYLDVAPNLDADMKAKFPTLEDKYDGQSGEVFVRVLKNMAGVKLTRQSLFTAADGGHAVRVSHKADSGFLYPLEKSFFYLPKPPKLLPYANVTEVEFERHSNAMHSAGKTFDMTINMKDGSSENFHGIARSEFQNLVNFLTAKGVTISNVDANARADAILDADASDDDDVDDFARRGGGDEDSEEDEDFAAGSDSDGGEPTDSDSDSDGDGDDDESKPKKKSKKSTPKKKAKKDPNAPKRGLSAYMFFSAAKRAEVLEQNPSFGVTDVAKELGARWKLITDEEKATYQQQADEDKARYEREMAEYSATAREPKADDAMDEDAADADVKDEPDAMDEDE